MGLYSSFYASLSGLSANASALSVIGNNLANLNTVGFKGSSSSFQDLFASASGASGTQGNGDPSQIGLGTRLGAISQDFSQGSFQSSGNATDMAIQGSGFFTLRTKDGSQAFSRSGNFSINKNGVLSDPSGNQVMGWNRTDQTLSTNGPTSPSTKWEVFPAATPLQSSITSFASASATSNTAQNGYGAGSVNSLTVDQNGVVIGNFTNGQTLSLAQVAITTFPNQSGLTKNGSNTWGETESSGVPNVGAANKGGRGAVLGANLELSNVDVATEFTALIIAQRGYQANSRLVTTSDQLLQETLNLKQ
jgi:flagellar hook protein FlgE